MKITSIILFPVWNGLNLMQCAFIVREIFFLIKNYFFRQNFSHKLLVFQRFVQSYQLEKICYKIAMHILIYDNHPEVSEIVYDKC